ncbi:hypothetical protein AWC38_SpisGene2554 [Stylophora pistillata]|uniref:Uncharacterized protein n=1 Tax=Stylophora pistillata TaxID=50429 RepID=A0A2B4SVQ4_STYPI|nr:hypothetical protein AWC38_SpisGene2554 [Stylophora pistillata]
MSAVAWTAPTSYRPSDAEIVIRLSLMPSRSNATKEMLKVHQFIASNWDLKETSLILGVADTTVCSSDLQKKDNFSIAFMHLYNFIHPLYLAYSYEEAKGSQHKVLASALKDTSFHLNTTVWRVRRESVTITDDVVKTYRNYVILYTLKDVLTEVLTCI